MSQFVETCTVCGGTGVACDHDFHTLPPDGQATECPSCQRMTAVLCQECQGHGEVWIDLPIEPSA